MLVHEYECPGTSEQDLKMLELLAIEKFECSFKHFPQFCRSKFHEFDMQPLCKKCYEKMPLELKKRLKKAEMASPTKRA